MYVGCAIAWTAFGMANYRKIIIKYAYLELLVDLK